MALYETVNPLVPSSRRGDDLGISSASYHAVTWISDLVLGLKKAKLERQTRKALSHLSDRTLEDIGLTRGDIIAGTYRGL